MAWGQLTTIDLGDCDKIRLADLAALRIFLAGLCSAIEMQAHGAPLVERFGEGSLHGNSGIQFIKTSSITVHCDEQGGGCYIDLFSCKQFDAKKAERYSAEFWGAKTSSSETKMRG